VAVAGVLNFEDAAARSYLLILRATGSRKGGSSEAAITVAATDANDAPRVVNRPGLAAVVVPESAAAGRFATVLAEDEDGDALSFAIVGGNPTGMFAIGRASGELSLTADGLLDFERERTYSMTVKVRAPARPPPARPLAC
jgi:hypothetical protein